MKKASRSIVVAIITILTLSACGNGQQGGTDAQEYVSSEQWIDLMADCMRERGWDVEIDEVQGGFGASVPEDQNDLYTAAIDECTDSIGVDVQPPSTDEWRELYDIRVAAVECLESHGIHVAVPSWTEFEASATTNSEWHPFIGLTESELEIASTECYVDGL